VTALNTFITNNIPREVQQGRDYTGTCGWIYLCNQLLRRLENEGVVSLTQRKETGVEVWDSYWINIPSDYRNDLEIYRYSTLGTKINIPFQFINGKIKLDENFDNDDDTEDFTLSSGGTTSVKINDDDAVENEYEGWLLVLTNGTYSGDSIIIGEHNEASGGLTTLNFLHTRSTSISDSTAGYLTQMYIMLRYMATFTGLTAYDDDIPIDSRYEDVLINGLCYLAKPVGSDERKNYRAEFENDLQLLRNEIFTPTPDQARPIGRDMPALNGYDQTSGKHDEFLGDTDAWMP
jgi:hypothetical protein